MGTVVVIEDDTNIADLVDMYLRRDGFRVIQAGTGETGLAAIERERPRMVILDVGLPGEHRRLGSVPTAAGQRGDCPCSC